MNNEELNLAKTALRVLPENGPAEFEQWFQATGARDEDPSPSSNPPFAIVNYDLSNPTPIAFPEDYKHFTDVVAEHLHTSSQSGPWGLLHTNVVVLRVSDQPGSRSGRVVLLLEDYFSVLLKKLFPRVNITQSEQHTLLQILVGYSLKQAADQDNVSYETKKSQIKSVFNKTQIRRQQELSSFLTAHITLEAAAQFSRSESPTEPDSEFFYYVDNFMGDYVRASVIQESADRRFRIIEIGDPAGLPVVCVHHLGILSFSLQEIQLIRHMGIRLICPLRHGAIAPRDKKVNRAEYLKHTIAGIDLAVSLVGEQKATLVTMLSGCFYALQYLEHHSQNVDKLVLLAATYKSENQTVSKSSFKRKLHRLAFVNDTTLTATISFMMRRVEKADQLRKVWETSLNHGAADMKAVADVFADLQQLSAMQYRLVHSTASITQDLRTQARGVWHLPTDNDDDAVAIHFIHGTDDQLIPIDGIKALTAANSNYQLHTVEHAGNWLFGEHSQHTFSVIRALLDTHNQSDLLQ